VTDETRYPDPSDPMPVGMVSARDLLGAYA
jgi:hypothetical protein